MTFRIGTPHTKGAGYFLDGKNLNVSQRTEADIRTCTHCQAVIKMQEWKVEGAWCGRCRAPICHPCGARAEIWGCEPFLKKLEKAVKAAGTPVPPKSIITG